MQEVEDPTIPSEKYLLTQRLFTFLDEWLFYLTLGILYYTEHYTMMAVVAVHGAIFILNSYRIQWKMEKKRFEHGRQD